MTTVNSATSAKPKEPKATFASDNHITIAIARVVAHLKCSLNDPDVLLTIEALRKEFKELKKKEKPTAAEKKKMDELDHKLKTLKEGVVRSGAGSGVAIATLATEMSKSLVLESLRHASSSDRKIVDVDSLMGAKLSQNPYWAFIRRSPTILEYTPEKEEQLKKDRAQAEKDRKMAKEEGREIPPKDKDSLPSFETYGERVIADVRHDYPEFKDTRFSKRYREFLSDIISDVIRRLGQLLRKTVLDLLSVSTLTDNHVLFVIEQLLADEIVVEAKGAKDPYEKVNTIVDPVKKMVEKYRAHVKAENAKKAEAKLASLSDEQKKALEEKEIQKKIEKLQNKIDAKKKKAQESVSEAKNIAAELKKLKI